MSNESNSLIDDNSISYQSDRSYSSFKNETKDDHDGLSADELKQKLYQSIKSKGILDSLKSQLRNKLVLELNTNGSRLMPKALVKDPFAIVENKKQRTNLALSTINSLILNHLKTHEYEYTLSVFMPECGLQLNDAYSLSDIFQILKISQESKIYKDLNDSNNIKSKGLLWFLVNHLCSTYVTKSIETQTDDNNQFGRAANTLDFKLKHLEKHYSDRYHELNLTNVNSVEEKLQAYQKKLEEKAKFELEQRIKDFKENELKIAQIEERDRMKVELVRAKEELDKIYQQRYASLNEKEKNIDEIVRHRRAIEEKEIFLQRQTILEDLSTLRERENEFKRSHESQSQKLESEMARVKQLEDDLRRREFQLKLQEQDYETRLKNEKERIRFDMERNFAQREFIAQSIERKNHEESKRLEEERAHMDKLMSEIQQKSFRINELEIELQRSRSQCVALMNENANYKAKLQEYLNYDIIQEENNYLKSQMESIKIHLGESFLKKRNIDVIQSKKSKVKFEVDETREIDEKVDVLHDLGDKILFAADESLALKSKIDEQTSANKDLRDLCEMQLLESRKLQDEVSDIKMHVKFLQNGISLPDDDEINNADFTRKQIQPPIAESNVANESVIFIERAKERLKNLEFEAEKIEKNYRDYHYKMKSISYPLTSDAVASSSVQSSFDIKEFLQKSLKPVDRPLQESSEKLLKSIYDEIDCFKKHESIKSHLIVPEIAQHSATHDSYSKRQETSLIQHKLNQSSSDSSSSESKFKQEVKPQVDIIRFLASPEKKSEKSSLSEKLEKKSSAAIENDETDRDTQSLKNDFAPVKQPAKYSFVFESDSNEEDGKISIGEQDKSKNEAHSNADGEDDDDFNY